MPQISAGLLVFRMRDEAEFLLAHPGGPFWARRDAAAWTIPKGLADPGEDLLAAARREFAEETGQPVGGDAFAPLSPVRRPGKILHAWLVEADLDLAGFCSNMIEIEWPPRSGRRVAVPECDRAAYTPLAEALRRIVPYQRPLLVQADRLVAAGA